MKNNATHTKR